MDTSTRAPGYDLFKLVVAVLLLLLFICLMFWIPANAPGSAMPTVVTHLVLTENQPVTETLSPPIPSPSTTSPSDSSTLTSLPLPSPSFTSTNYSLTYTALTSTSSPLSPPTGTATLIPSPTAPATTSQTQTTAPPTIVPSPTETPVPEATVTAVIETPSSADVCEAALSRSQLQVGGSATILRRLNFRASPGIQNNWLQTNLPATQVEVIDGPVCLPHLIGAYVWWQIRLPDGQVGWSAEASLLGRFYFMEPAN